MTKIEYQSLSDEEKIELLRLLYQDVKQPRNEREAFHKEKIIAETQIVYNRLKQRSH